MSKSFDETTDVTDRIGPELREAVSRFGFAKVAARMYGVDEISEETAAGIIGTNLMTRLAEWRQVDSGLKALAALKKG